LRISAQGTLRNIVLGLMLLLAGGCAIHSTRPEDGPRTGEDHLEKLLAGQQYQQALEFLPGLASAMDSAAYEAENLRVLALINDLETETESRSSVLLAQNKPFAALEVVDRALRKIPASSRLLELQSNLRQKIAKRKKDAEWALLISRADYLSDQLREYRELALLQKPSWFTNWRLAAFADNLATFRPQLVECGREALAAAKSEVAERCLQLAGEIEASETVEQLLAQARASKPGPETEPEPAAGAEPILEPVAKAKKNRPAPPAGSSLAELENRLQAEIAREDLKQGYATLSSLAEIPNATELWRNYKTQLDRTRARLVAKYLEDATAHYRGGKIAQAREDWLLVLELEPDNQTARQKLARADRVLRNLRGLQETQQQMAPAQ